MRLSRAELEKIDLEPLRPYVASPQEFFGKHEHYRLLAYLASKLPDGARIIDIGTHQGDSALALSLFEHEVWTFDMENRLNGRVLPSNITPTVGIDLFDPRIRELSDPRVGPLRHLILKSALILIDIDPHEGARELEFVRWLLDNEYRGIIVLDDIWYFKSMRDNLWRHIDTKYKIDATSLGHWSGTGLVSFGDPIVIDDAPNTDNWTLVTGYFDLTSKVDATDAIRARPAQHYLDEHGTAVLALDKNLIVFCDRNLETKIWELRPEYLHHRTRVIPLAFEDFPLSGYLLKVIQNRSGTGVCPADPRNTASYYLFCMARYAMVKEALTDNPFGSTHFAWINVCVERMGFNNLVHLDEALGLNREKFSTCWIDYVPEDLVKDLPSYFSGCVGRCSMCSGFFTGSKKFMLEVCNRIEAAFVACAEQGFGHADEQLYSMVYFEHPELFEWYCGDYQEMITNYAGIYERPDRPINQLIRNSFENGDHAVCKKACDIVLESFYSGKCKLAPEDCATLMFFRNACQ